MSDPPLVTIHPARERFRTERDGITTFHSFSYGRHYDPDNVGFGPIIALNEENVPPAGGYESHFHADVEIVTWVMSGGLAHEDTAGSRGIISPGTLQWLSAGDGVQHAEHNASATEPLRFMQLMLRSDHHGEPAYATFDAGVSITVPAEHAPASVVIATGSMPVVGPALVHVTHGSFTLNGPGVHGAPIGPGDEARISSEGAYDLNASEPAGALIVLVR